jgi:ABC-2 type transport system ATP-binding protein
MIQGRREIMQLLEVMRKHFPDCSNARLRSGIRSPTDRTRYSTFPMTSEPAPTPIIRAQGLTKAYGSHLAVDNISFAVKRGEILGLLGPNGAGKSTTIRMVTGYLRPSAGSVHIAGQNIEEEPLASKRLLGYLPESAPLYPEMLAYDYLRYVARVRAVPDRDIVDELHRVADLCGLNEAMHQAFNELSRGYRQRVGLAHAIIGDPEILILDEPTSGLDPNQIVEIRSFIKNIGKDKTIIFSSHVLSEVEAICDRIVIIYRGKIVADSDHLLEPRPQRGRGDLRSDRDHLPRQDRCR